jgi:hypothetical protein
VFLHVRVIRSTAPALYCAIEGKRVWLPRHHVKGNLVCRGDCGTLFIRRWLAFDRRLTGLVQPSGVPKKRLGRRLHLVPSHSEAHLGH